MSVRSAEPLPASAGGLLRLACSVLAQRFALAVGLVALYVPCRLIAARLFPGAEGVQIAIDIVLQSFAVAAIALAVGNRLAGETAGMRAILSAATLRWGASAISLLLLNGLWIAYLGPTAGFARIEDQGSAVIVAITAPFAWLLTAALALGAPAAALSEEDVLRAGFTATGRALFLALRVRNLARLAIVALVTIGPSFLVVLYGHANGPTPYPLLDTIVSGLVLAPTAAVQAVFIIDFARRAATPPSR